MAYNERLIDLDHLEDVLPKDDSSMLCAVAPMVDQFVLDTQILERIDQRFFADGLVDKVMVFQYIGPAFGEQRTAWWVVVGDIPPFIDAVQPNETAVDVLHTYSKLIRLSLDPSMDTEGIVKDLPPLSYQYSTKPIPMTPELEVMIRSRLDFIEATLIPWLQDDRNVASSE